MNLQELLFEMRDAFVVFDLQTSAMFVNKKGEK